MMKAYPVILLCEPRLGLGILRFGQESFLVVHFFVCALVLSCEMGTAEHTQESVR